MRDSKFRRLFSTITICLLMAACSVSLAAPTVVPSATVIQNTATVTPSSTYTLTPKPTLTATPTATLTITPTGTPSEPAGCQEPPEDYTRIDLPYATVNQRTYVMLQHAQTLYDGPIDILNAITQGSYTESEAASFGTHSGGGAVDVSVIDVSTWTVLWDEIDALVLALRTAGFAAWLRPADALYPGSPIHIHAVAVGDAELSYPAYLQIYGDYGYLAGMDGLPPEEGEEPTVDPHGGPLICDWMKE